MAQNGAEPSAMQTECLVQGLSAILEINVRFLASDGSRGRSGRPARDRDSFESVPELRVDDELYQTWHEAVERNVCAKRLGALLSADRERSVSLPGSQTLENIC